MKEELDFNNKVKYLLTKNIINDYSEEWNNYINNRKKEIVDNQEEKMFIQILKEYEHYIKLDSNSVLNLTKDYKSDYEINLEFINVYFTEKKLFTSYYLNEFHGGRVGFIHGASIYSLCLISNFILFKLSLGAIPKNESSIKVKYIKPLKSNGFAFVKANLNLNNEVDCEVIDIYKTVCTKVTFSYHQNNANVLKKDLKDFLNIFDGIKSETDYNEEDILTENYSEIKKLTKF